MSRDGPLSVSRLRVAARHGRRRAHRLLGRLKDAGGLRPEQISLGKLNNVREAIAICRQARTILGGNGSTLDHSPLRHANNLESVRTYEGTDEIHTLIMGRAITGIPAFSPGPAS
jgi:glutaryl-CoA dehydrogenase